MESAKYRIKIEPRLKPRNIKYTIMKKKKEQEKKGNKTKADIEIIITNGENVFIDITFTHLALITKKTA